MKVVHLSTAHEADDVRIFHKECVSAAAAGHEVVLIVSRGSDEDRAGVRIRAVGRSGSGRFSRVTGALWRVLRAGLRERGDVYHVHEPELILAGLALRLRGRRVVYDVHENYPAAMTHRPWVPAALRRPLAWLFDRFERWSAGRLAGIVTVNDEIAARFPERKTIQVRNYVRGGAASSDVGAALAVPQADYGSRPNAACFLGAMTAIRGITETVKAISLLPAELEPKLILAGEFAPPSYREEIERLWDPARVEFLGQIPVADVPAVYARSRATIVPYHPCPNHTDASPNKMFEGMAAGLPVIASDFPKWRPIIEQHGCGLLVDPLRPESIAEALRWVFEHPDEAEAMGQRGRAAALEHYTWESQAAKLLDLYDRIATR